MSVGRPRIHRPEPTVEPFWTPLGMETVVRFHLTKGKTAIVNLEDWPQVQEMAWYAKQGKAGVWYAANKIRQRVTYLHRLLMPQAKLIDHRNGDGLDNRRSNLRECTQNQNCQNTKVRKGRRFKGCYFSVQARMFIAAIHYQGKKIHLGSFNNQISAAIAYDKAALKYYGEFARLNFPEVGVRSQ